MKTTSTPAFKDLSLRIVIDIEAPAEGSVLDVVGLIKSIKAFLQIFPWKAVIRSAVVR